jgi:hypothetical protein
MVDKVNDWLNQITSRIITRQMTKQQNKGLEKYGRLADEAADELPSKDLAQHALEEAVDGAYYAAMLVSKLETMALIWDDTLDALESHLVDYNNGQGFDEENLAHDLSKLVECYKRERGKWGGGDE